MIEGVMADPLALIGKFESQVGDPAAKLWAYLYVDTRQLCLAPYDYSWMLTTAETRAPQFQFFWDDREKLLAWIQSALEDGIQQGVFAKTDLEMAARTILSWMNSPSVGCRGVANPLIKLPGLSPISP